MDYLEPWCVSPMLMDGSWGLPHGLSMKEFDKIYVTWYGCERGFISEGHLSFFSPAFTLCGKIVRRPFADCLDPKY